MFQYYVKPFLRPIYFLPWSLLLLWLTLFVLYVFDYALWIQGYLDVGISSLIFLLFVVSFFIVHAIVRNQETVNHHIIVLPFAAVVFSVIFIFILSMQTTTREYYSEFGYTIIVETEDSSTIDTQRFNYAFYKQEGILAKRVAYCETHGDYECNYYISGGSLIIEVGYDGDTTNRQEIPLD